MRLDKERSGEGDKLLLLVIIGEIITKRRQFMNMSQERLAKRAGVNRPYISDIERGRRNMSVLTLVGISLGLGCTPAEVLEEAHVIYLTNRKRRRQS